LLIGLPLLGWVASTKLIGRVAEFGGVPALLHRHELRPARLWVMRRHVFELGSEPTAAVRDGHCGLGFNGAAWSCQPRR
jgi:hypothetical protein